LNARKYQLHAQNETGEIKCDGIKVHYRATSILKRFDEIGGMGRKDETSNKGDDCTMYYQDFTNRTWSDW